MNTDDGDELDETRQTIGQRIKQARNEAAISQDALAEALGVSRVAVSNWERGKDLPGIPRFKRIAEVLHCDGGWLLLGAPGANLDDVPSAQKIREMTAVYTARTKVPLVSQVPGGAQRLAADPYTRGAAEDWLTPTGRMSEGSFALRVHGNSMEPDFPDGCVIFVDPGVQWKSGDFVVVRFEDTDEATFKRIVKDGGHMLLVPLNPQYPTRQLSGNFTVCGVVREMRRLVR
jgi:SOS-response transcriptional repressor LexA